MLLVRHAQSAWNEAGRWQGHADPPLSDLGRRQAAAAAGRLGTVDAIVASPLERAHHTAVILAESTGIGPVVVHPDLIERDVGEWSGLTRAEIETGWPGFLEAGERPAGFEPDEPLVARALAALAELAAAHPGGELLVVTHGGVISAIERAHGHPRAPVPNLTGRSIDHSGVGIVIGDRLALLDDDDLTIPARR
jgi:probable phosphoglycerate mutase